jgi:hypothetical protein
MSERESQGDQDASAGSRNTAMERRRALRTLSKAAYVAPAVIATLAATKARAAS